SEFALEQYLTDRTLGISLGAPWIFRKPFIERFHGRLINGHGTRLPRNRGGATFSWQLMRGDYSGCHLFHLIDGGIDTGPIIFSNEFMFPETCRTPIDFQRVYRDTEIDFFGSFFAKIRAGEEFTVTQQDEHVSTYFPRLSTLHNGYINWEWSAEEIARFISAFDEPYEGASTFHLGERVFLHGASATSFDGTFHPFMSGLVYRNFEGALSIAARDGSVVVRRVVREGGEDITNRIRAGARFVTPREILDAALAYIAQYDARGLRISHDTPRTP
ncbi:MAG: formyltransferase family protein, partial [bacterium]|nr:formyltransferase family protein [bacterium]